MLYRIFATVCVLLLFVGLMGCLMGCGAGRSEGPWAMRTIGQQEVKAETSGATAKVAVAEATK